MLCLSANTSFADFPRLCRLLALDGFLPARASRIAGAGWSTRPASCCWRCCPALLLVVFGGVTDRLIPLFAVGAFLAFTLSQLGMVVHWRRARGQRFRLQALAVNAVGVARDDGDPRDRARRRSSRQGRG